MAGRPARTALRLAADLSEQPGPAPSFRGTPTKGHPVREHAVPAGIRGSLRGRGALRGGAAGPILSLLRSSGLGPRQAPDRAPAGQDEDPSSGHRPIRCRPCGAVIADGADLFHPVEGQGQVFFNPHGILHEVVTLRRTRGVVPQGPATTEFTWFAGYAWRHAHCARCGAHLGWRYEAVSSEAALPGFWGLRRSEIILEDQTRS